MVKSQQLVGDGGGRSKVRGVAIHHICGRSGKRRLYDAHYAHLQALKMLSQKRAEVDTEGEPGAGSAKGGGGGSDNGAVTPGSSNGEGSKEFLSTGRTGRRNAMPDILGHHAVTGTADLSTRFGALSTGAAHDQPGTSGLVQGEASTSQEEMG